MVVPDGQNEVKTEAVGLSEKKSTKSIVDLPDDILNIIGDYLMPVTACRAVATCTRLRDIWRHIPSSELEINDFFGDKVAYRALSLEQGGRRSINYLTLEGLLDSLKQWKLRRLFLKLDPKKYSPNIQLYDCFTNLLFEWTPYLRLLSVECSGDDETGDYGYLCALMATVAFVQLRNSNVKTHLKLYFADSLHAKRIGLQLLPKVDVLDVRNVDLTGVDKLFHIEELWFSNNDKDVELLPIAAKLCYFYDTTIAQEKLDFQDNGFDELHLINITANRPIKSEAKRITVDTCENISVAAPLANELFLSTCSNVTWTSFLAVRSIVYFRSRWELKSRKQITLATAAHITIADKEFLDNPDLINTDHELPLLEKFTICEMPDRIMQVFILLKTIMDKAAKLNSLEIQLDDLTSAVALCEITGLFGASDNVRLTHCATCDKPKYKLPLDILEFKKRGPTSSKQRSS